MKYNYKHEKGATLNNRQEQSFTIKKGTTFSLEENATGSIVVDSKGNQFRLPKEMAAKLIERSEIVNETESFLDKIKRVIPVAEEYLKEAINEGMDNYIKMNGSYFQGIVVDVGPKYTRLSVKSGGQQSAWCFIDNETEQLWKPASYKAPTKNFARGTLDNLLDRKFVRSHKHGF